MRPLVCVQGCVVSRSLGPMRRQGGPESCRVVSINQVDHKGHFSHPLEGMTELGRDSSLTSLAQMILRWTFDQIRRDSVETNSQTNNYFIYRMPLPTGIEAPCLFFILPFPVIPERISFRRIAVIHKVPFFSA